VKRIVIYVATLALLSFAPVKGAELGKLRPVEVVLVYEDAGTVVIATDTEDVGHGEDGLSALQNLKATTAGTVYLDTAAYLLIGEGGQTAAEQLRSHLKKNTKVCMAENDVDLKNAAAYLSVHGDLPRLKQWKIGHNLCKLRMVGGRFLLE
jgi:hypothetical protein